MLKKIICMIVVGLLMIPNQVFAVDTQVSNQVNYGSVNVNGENDNESIPNETHKETIVPISGEQKLEGCDIVESTGENDDKRIVSSKNGTMFATSASTMPGLGKYEITKSGGKYKVTIKITNVNALDKVLFPTWTSKNGQDDIVWGKGTINGDTVTYTVDFKDHKYETGQYITHIYAYDKAGQYAMIALPTQNIANSAPGIGKYEITKSAGKYKISVKVSDDYALDKVLFPTWTSKNGQDDIVWGKGTINGDTVTYTVDFKDHKYETGQYITHIYAYDKAGQYAMIALPTQNIANSAPHLSNIKVSNVTAQGYTVTCNVSDDYGIDRVMFPSWTSSNGQDDVVWHQGTISNGIATCRITIDKHGYAYGDYITHIYAYDKAGVATWGSTSQNIVPANSNPGWTYKNGRKYLFDQDGVFVQRSRYFVIDVSKWQGNVDWDKLARESSVDAVILRISYATGTDSKVKGYVAALNRLGIPYGFYHYNTAKNESDALVQAKYAIQAIKDIGGSPTLPVYADIEEGGNDRNQVAIAKVYCEYFQSAGYTAGVYANLNYWNNYLNDPSLNKYVKWIANYGKNNGLPKSGWRPNNSYAMWQYTSKGSIPGISGNVDLNVMFE